MKVTAYILIIFGIFFPVSAFGWTVALLTGSGGLGDESFNDMTWKGLGKAREECGFNLIFREWEQHIAMDQLLHEMLAEGADLVVLNGDQFLPLINDYATKYPQILFIANDFYGGDFPNLKSILYNQHEVAFLAGALAALHSRTGKLGFIGAIDIPVIKAFKVGFTEGAKYVSPQATVKVDYVSKLPDYSGFNNPPLALQLATAQYAKGIDVIFTAAGVSGNGVIQAARISRRFVIGVDADQDHMAKGHVLTSVMKRLDIALYRETVEAFRGNFSPGTTRYGLENGGISLTPMEYTRDIIGKDTINILQKLKKEIISKKIIVPDILDTSQ